MFIYSKTGHQHSAAQHLLRKYTCYGRFMHMQLQDSDSKESSNFQCIHIFTNHPGLKTTIVVVGLCLGLGHFQLLL